MNSNSVFKLIQILRVNRSLTKFLIYYQEMNENTLIELVNSLMVNRVINFVGFSARNMKKFAEVFGAFGILITRGASLKISIRNADFLAFLKGDEKLQKKREFFDLIHEIERGNKIVEIPEECIKWKEKRPKILRVPMKIENAPTVIGEDWSILQPEIPAIDNTDILKSLKSRFSYLIAQSQ
ncbi:hypothetical protein TRFO_14540 [Tritrichomonas foetus]|uniref:Uncharacterized protein n=1 Tax=Tritrichomonas foetus TaxID=1144522 RepID=A0A1J4KUS0_9EUKA|nr:hypothetical protein TRFO_14540 [Tritrichomonas foetus]|eukprot:OHT15033.1 hypothetical protein TRFO_14540 [Tritrichomonas foetus]